MILLIIFLLFLFFTKNVFHVISYRQFSFFSFLCSTFYKYDFTENRFSSIFNFVRTTYTYICRQMFKFRFEWLNFLAKPKSIVNNFWCFFRHFSLCQMASILLIFPFYCLLVCKVLLFKHKICKRNFFYFPNKSDGVRRKNRKIGEEAKVQIFFD